MVANRVEVDVSSSKDFDTDVIARDPSEFIYYPYTVDVESAPGLSLKSYLEQVSTVMIHLAGEGATVVASCDWEQHLPGSGRLGSPFGGKT
ncbi:MAG: hypothetical protein JKY56_16530 [Kofleriaceae bacterium]|nr:hypothetical protein [Kofleriaceae bacterium]